MKILKFIFGIFFLIFLTGCWDKVELEERGLVLAIGIDKFEDSAKNEKIISSGEQRLIFSLSLPDVSEVVNSDDNSNKQKDTEQMPKKEEVSITKNEEVKKAVSSSVISAMNLADTYSEKNLYYGHTKVVVLGNDLLKDKQLFKETIDSLERNKEINRKLIVLSTNSDAQDILEFVPKEQNKIGLFISEFYQNNQNNLSMTFKQDLESVIQDLLKTGNTVIPQINIEDGVAKITGLSLIKDYRLIGNLNEELTRNYLFITNKLKSGEIEVFFEDVFIPLKIVKAKTNITMEDTGKNIVCYIKTYIEGNILEYSLNKNIMFDEKKYNEVTKMYEKRLIDEIFKTINFVKYNYDFDIFNIKEIAKKNFNKIYKKYNLESKNIYENIDFKVVPEVKIRSAGSIK